MGDYIKVAKQGFLIGAGIAAFCTLVALTQPHRLRGLEFIAMAGKVTATATAAGAIGCTGGEAIYNNISKVKYRKKNY